MLKVQLFGTGRLRDDFGEIKLRSRAWTLPLLAYLLLHAGELLPRQRVAFALWPDEMEEAALRNLRRNLHRLSRALPAVDGAEPWIVLAGHSLAWNASAACTVDVVEFERLRVDSATLEQAVALYSGALLEEFHEDWIATEREALRQSYHAALRELIVAHRSRRAFAAASQYAQRLLDADPWQEDALRQLMSIRYESGDAAGAVGVFGSFADKLRTEMRVEPMAETVALRDAIVRGASIPGMFEESGTARKPGPAPAPFIGRADDLRRLHGKWLRAAGGRGSIGFVRGEAGIGKSRLVSELALIVEAEGGRVITGMTSSPERDPYQPLASALRGALPLVAQTSVAPPLLATIAALAPELRSELPDLPQLVRMDPKNEHARLIDALAQVLVALAQPRPLLVILEDVHRAGSATLEAIGDIVPRLSRSAVLVLATYRQEEADRNPSLRALERALHPAAERFSLRPLDRDDVGLLVEAIARAGAATADFIAAVAERSQGNPLFVTELARDASASPSTPIAIPASMAVMMAERLTSLGPAARTVVEVAAVAGESFTVDLVREVGGLPESELLDVFDELLDRHFIRESTERGRYEYAFTHHLVHASVYDAMATDARRRRHRRVAHVLDVNGPEGGDVRAAEIALHYERGGNPSKAAAHYAIAAQRGAQRYANAEARDFVTRALELGEWDPRRRFDLMMLGNSMSARLADERAERDELAQMERVADEVDDDALCSTLVRQVNAASRYGDYVWEGEAIERLRLRAGQGGKRQWLAAAAEARATRALRDADPSGALAGALEARDIYEALRDDVAQARAGALAARVSCTMRDGAIAARRLADDALRLARRVGDAETLLKALASAGFVAQQSQDYATMADLNREGLALCLQLGSRSDEIRRRTGIGIALWRAWHIGEALEALREALRVAESVGIISVASILANIGGILVEVGDSSAIEWLERAADHALEPRSLLGAGLNLAEAYWRWGRLDAARETLHRAELIAERMQTSRHHGQAAQLRGRLLRCERTFAASAHELALATELYQQTGRWSDAADALDDLALTHLAAGSISSAGDALARRASVVEDHDYRSIRHLWVEACVRRSAADTEASRQTVQRANALLSERLAALNDPGQHASFDGLPMHRAVRAAHERDEWPHFGAPAFTELAF